MFMGDKILFKSVTKVFGKKKVMDSLDLTIREGEILGLIGASGSGKTTLFKLLVGFYAPEDGDILLKYSQNLLKQNQFASVKKHLSIVRRNIGFAPQNPSFYPDLTTYENLMFFSSMYDLPFDVKQANIDSLLKLTHLDASKDALAKNLSFGMQKRLGIACALVHKPDIFILDEPTADLDPILRYEIWDLIKQINHSGTTVLIATHFLDEAEQVCDRIAVLKDGKIVEIDTFEQLKLKYSKNDLISMRLPQNKFERVSRMLNRDKLPISKIVKSGNRLTLHVSKTNPVLGKVLKLSKAKELGIEDITVSKPSLISVFEDIMR